ncbi:MAG: hydantoinase/oxoprolinase family protein [Alphaproteobacteria bacterium]|nr:hydantoinase/oxoprolinase family protein [Alphaproteobacteria bacterium]
MIDDTTAPADIRRRAFRIGIDVGGTFTKAVLIDNATHEVLGRYTRLTTHDDPRGVAAGVVEVFREVLHNTAVLPSEVVFIAHSTTQATNALLEGDVATVGIVGLSSRMEALLARRQTNVGRIELAPGRFMEPAHRHIVSEESSPDAIGAAVAALKAEGVRVVVASSAFGVDDGGPEVAVMEAAVAAGLSATGGHEITKLYGLTTRTRTAVINASILPKMIDTANMTETAVREAGIVAPLMIMRGDGGVMDIAEMRRRPAMTMLSGPAASVAGALMHLKVSDGIYFEVGGTSTNMGVIRNGLPTVKYARVGGHETYVSSLDVRVAGVAGGSMVRLAGRKIADVGPRSAHIAGLHYAAFADPNTMKEPKLELFRPKPNDPDDYVAIRCADGERYAITNTCAANVLGYAKPGLHSSGNVAAARIAMEVLAAAIGESVEETARQILAAAAKKVIPMVEDLIAEYRLDRDQAVLIGEGGGAASLIPYVSEVTGLPFQISRDAEVISSIGVALALVRETVERTIPNARTEDLDAIKREAFDAVVRLGAAPENVEVTVEVDPKTHRVRATAMGASEMRAHDMLKEISEDEAREIAAKSMAVDPERVKVAAATPRMRVFQGLVEEKKWGGLFKKRRRPLRAVDIEGVIRIQRSDGVVRQTAAGRGLADLKALWEEITIYNGDSIITPDVFVIAGAHVLDLSGMNGFAQAEGIAKAELVGMPDDAPVVLVAIQGARGF